MYNDYDVQYELLAHQNSVAIHGDRICNSVKKGRFSFDTFSINTYQSIEYLLNKGATDAVEITLIDKLQDLHDREKVTLASIPVVITEDGILPTYTVPYLTKTDLATSTATTLVGDIITGTFEVNLNRGQILEPWNSNVEQNKRSGNINLAIATVDKLPSVYIANAGTVFTLAQNLTMTIDDGLVKATFTNNDIQVGYGRLTFGVSIFTDIGNIPKDSNGSLLYDLVYDSVNFKAYNANSNTNKYEFNIYGITPIYHGASTASNTLLPSSASKTFNFLISDTGNDAIIEISDADILYRGTPVIKSNTIDVTSDFVITSITKTLSNALDLPYKKYTLSVADIQTSLYEITFPNTPLNA
jgi:hypothetical protein